MNVFISVNNMVFNDSKFQHMSYHHQLQHKSSNHIYMIYYRPISLLPTISKIFERVIHDQMYEYFNKFKLLAEQQYGFRKQHSTEYAAVKLIDHVSREMEAGKIPANVYTDLSKAFDTLTFDILLYKLKYYGVTDTALDLMKSYLTNRKQYVVFDGCQSEHTEIYTGVPQGSILGPLFFCIFFIFIFYIGRFIQGNKSTKTF